MQHTYIHEVVARDGLQIEPQFVPTEQKIELIDALSETGLAKIEVTSFVSPKAVPNLRDAETVMAGIKRNPLVKYVALIANLKGAERAIASRADEVNFVRARGNCPLRSFQIGDQGDVLHQRVALDARHHRLRIAQVRHRLG